jgi:hypothetical protein
MKARWSFRQLAATWAIVAVSVSREIAIPNGASEYVDSSDMEAGRIDRRAIQKRVADGAKLFVWPRRFCSAEGHEIRAFTPVFGFSR